MNYIALATATGTFAYVLATELGAMVNAKLAMVAAVL